MMRRLAAHFPQYGFETNVGYAAPRHLDALRDHGPSPAHRLSFSPMRDGR
jgi:ribonuclease HII